MDFELEKPIPNFRFMVTFFPSTPHAVGSALAVAGAAASLATGITPPIDARFQKVSGLELEIEAEPVGAFSESYFHESIPKGIGTSKLTLERGMVIGSLLKAEFFLAMETFRVIRNDLLIVLLQEDSVVPFSAWMFLSAFPVSWSFGDLDAENPGLMIETITLAYSRMYTVPF